MENEELKVVYDSKYDLSDDYKSPFTVARDEYNSLVKYLSDKVFVGRVDYEHKLKNTEFDVKQGLKDLDMILQYSLLELEFKNGKVRDEVIDAIEGVCRYGSLMKEFREGDEYFNWTDFSQSKSKEVFDKLDSLNIYILKVSKDFSNFLKFYDQGDDYFFRTNIQKKMNNIINVLWYQSDMLLNVDYLPPCLANAVFKQLVK